ncbi:MAG: PAS domain-containing protein, partial [Firmicutes bacterium]|nr:PAS domain-containing protein [Bacillota bacterium]
MKRVLFVGQRNACRAPMAGAFARAQAPPGVEVLSAGLAGGPVHPLVVRVMAEAGLEVDPGPGPSLEQLGPRPFDLVVVLSPRVREQYPVLQGIHGVVYWNLPDPLARDLPEGELLSALRECRDAVRARVHSLFGHGYFHALVTLKDNAVRVLDSLTEGVVAHDLSRRIFFFNSAAERITGYRREEVLGRDCYQVFPGGFCGHKCTFAEKGVCVPEDEVNYTLD